MILDKGINELELDTKVLKILKDNDINLIRDLWKLQKRDLKKINLDDNDIRHIMIKLQLKGLDFNHRIYPKN